jgi:hypothetical protein
MVRKRCTPRAALALSLHPGLDVALTFKNYRSQA